MDESDDPPHHELRPAPKKKEEEEGRMEEKKEGNVLFFTYGYVIGHMMKDHSESEKATITWATLSD